MRGKVGGLAVNATPFLEPVLQFEYTAHDSHHYAKKVTQEIVDKAGVLNDLPPHRSGGARSR